MAETGEGAWDGDHFRPGSARRDGLLGAALIASALMLEREQDRWFLWLPVLFAGGVVAYFALTDEPGARMAVALLIGALGLALAARNAPLGLCLGGAALAFACGFAGAKLRTEMVRSPVLERELRYAEVTGFIETHELRERGRARIMLRVLELGALPPDQRPYRVRLTLPTKDEAVTLAVGDAIHVKATLQPPPEPIEPGGFDFARQAWFARIGGTGFATSKAVGLNGAPQMPWDIAAWASVDRLRAAVNARIRAVLAGETGEIAAALITGERGGISEEVTQSMRDSGLAHILSISGLHMVIMAGTVFWLMRALLALVPALALRYPIKKWAAASALAAATFYLALSGAAVPTVRSWIMMSIVLIAVMLDRPALTMRNVALAHSPSSWSRRNRSSTRAS
jgi:competence protein ComEC